MSDVQAGGVSGGVMLASGARTPPAASEPRKGITPRSMSGSRTVNVAPSRPIMSVLPNSDPSRRSVDAVPADEIDEVRDGDVPFLDRPLADLGVVLGKRQLPVAVLEHRSEHHEVERFQAEVARGNASPG